MPRFRQAVGTGSKGHVERLELLGGYGSEIRDGQRAGVVHVHFHTENTVGSSGRRAPAVQYNPIVVVGV